MTTEQASALYSFLSLLQEEYCEGHCRQAIDKYDLTDHTRGCDKLRGYLHTILPLTYE